MKYGGSFLSTNLKGKLILITGANSGIGKATAAQLAQMQAHVIMLCRNQESASAAKNEILTQSPKANVDIMIVDLASLADVKRVAKEINVKYPRLDVLINNAGVFNQKRTTTTDGLEATFGVNYLAHFALTLLLLDLLKKSAAARIINVSSDIHRFMGINMKDLMSERNYNSQKAYSNSEAALVLITNALSHRLQELKVAIVCAY